MLVDELKIAVEGGSGGDGVVHFARRKFQPFGGPDGGDGGEGGEVRLVGCRDMGSLVHLKKATKKAQNGQPGGKSLKAGAGGANLELRAPLGTLAYDARTEQELGFVSKSGDQVVLARGGRGGKGNPHFATGSRRAPKVAETGQEGQKRSVLLRFRLFSECALVEPTGQFDGVLLPRLLDRAAPAIDYAVYERQPCWVRAVYSYRRYDIAFIPLNAATVAPYIQLARHLYWTRSAFFNLYPLGVVDSQVIQQLLSELEAIAFRRFERLVICTSKKVDVPVQLQTSLGKLPIESYIARNMDDIYTRFAAQLTGGIIE